MAAKLFIVVLRNLRRQLRRTILTAVAFAITVFIYAVLIAVPESMNRLAEEASQGLRLIVLAPNAYRLPAKYCDPIRRMPHVVACASEILFGGVYKDPHDVIMASGITPDIFTLMASSDYHPPPEKLREMATDRRNAAIGSMLMRLHGWKLGQPITLRSPSDSHMALTFIPVVELPTYVLSKALFFDRRLLDDAVKNSYGVDIQDRANLLGVRVDRAENMGLVANEIDENFHNSEFETETTTEADTIANYVTAIGDVRTIVYGLSIVVLLTVLLISANSMAMMVRDRTAEVAVMRSLGFTRLHIATLLLSEAAIIGLCGATIGAAAALWCFSNGTTLGAVTGPSGFMEVRPATAITAVAVALAVSLISAIVPVINVACLPPALAIRKVI